MLPLLEEQKQKKRAAAKSKKKKKRADLEWCDKSRVFALPSLAEIDRLLSDTRNTRDKHEDDLKQESVCFFRREAEEKRRAEMKRLAEELRAADEL
jgi:hypothetical protein